MKKIYIASPYSDPDPNHSPEKRAAIQRGRYIEVCRILAQLMQEHPGYMFFSPIAHSHGIAKYGNVPGDHKTWEEVDRKWITWADELWIADMPGRLVSVGIMDFEIPYARDNGKPIEWL